MTRPKKELSDAALQMIADRFKIMSEPVRLKILHALSDGELSVGDIIEASAGLQANISKHLGILQQSGLVTRRKDGLNAYYRICDETVFELCEVVCASLNDRLVAQMNELLFAPPKRKSA